MGDLCYTLVGKESVVGLGPFTYPRYAVHAPTGRAVPISRMQAGCLWYPQLGIDGLLWAVLLGLSVAAALLVWRLVMLAPQRLQRV